MCPDKKGKFVGLSYPKGKGVLVCTSETGTLLHWTAESLDNAEGSSDKVLEPDSSIQLAKPIGVAKMEPGDLRLAYGGQENDVKLWDLEAKKLAWSAKNVRTMDA